VEPQFRSRWGVRAVATTLTTICKAANERMMEMVTSWQIKMKNVSYKEMNSTEQDQSPCSLDRSYHLQISMFCIFPVDIFKGGMALCLFLTPLSAAIILFLKMTTKIPSFINSASRGSFILYLILSLLAPHIPFAYLAFPLSQA